MPDSLHPGNDRTPNPRRQFLQLTAALVAAGALAPAASLALDDSPEQEAQKFLKEFLEKWLPLDTAASKAEWLSVTDVSDAHNAEYARRSNALDAFLGDAALVENVKKFLAVRDQLQGTTTRQLEVLLLILSTSPGTIPDIVRTKNEIHARQLQISDGFNYTLKSADGPEQIGIDTIDGLLVESDSLGLRRTAWESSKEIGEKLRPGLLYLRDLRNRISQEMGFKSFFELQVADYGMTVDEMMQLTESLVDQNRPLYEQLHTWAKYRLAEKYGIEKEDIPAVIPAHWLPNRWAQNWPKLVDGIDLDSPFAGKPKEYVIQQAEAFYMSMGFPKLPENFHTKSDLYPVTDGSRKKNSSASTFHMNRDDDVRSLMSIEPDSDWFTTTHHELGHAYYFLSYSLPEVPILLRTGANRAFHEAIGDLIGLAANQPKYLDSIGMLPPGAPAAGSVEWLLEPALNKFAVVFIPFAAGTMTRFEKEFYSGEINDDALNVAWWNLARRYQGIAPPGDRSEKFCDAATKNHINDDPAQYYDYALGTIIKFQLHDHIARNILNEEPQNCNYFGNRKVGDFLRELFKLGGTKDWRLLLKEATGSELSAKPMLAYFEPLLDWLKKENASREVGWEA